MIPTRLRKLLLFCVTGLIFHSLNSFAGDVTIIDSRHYSNVFGEIRNFRIFLPPGYFENPEKRYPVIYFYHGWSQRYFGSGPDSYNSFEKGDDNGGDNIANFVAGHDVIVVTPDGYNRRPDEEYYLRPYNVLPVETFRQYPVYFPELVAFIDATYKTIPDREHRAVSGLSMGGFMSFWIGGKYPQLISAIGNFCGSDEFVVGPRDFPAEYRHMDMFNNYDGIKVRLNYGNEDFIRFYHRDLNNIWTMVMDNYECKIYPAAHSTCGMGEMFSFLLRAFENPLPRPEIWSHTDVYPDFSVWGWDVRTDRDISGFTVLDNVGKKGFCSSVREFLPDGELMPFVNVSIVSHSIYEPNSEYTVSDLDLRVMKNSSSVIKSDDKGRLRFTIDGSRHEIGISKKDDTPDLVILSVAAGTDNIARCGRDVQLSLTLLNRGNKAAEGVHAVLTPFRKSAAVLKGLTDPGKIAANGTSVIKSFVFRVDNDSIQIEKFKLTLSDKNGNLWTGYFEVPLFSGKLPEFKDFEIADGRVVTVVKEGVREETTILGTGNGDGIANPGESIVVLIRDKGKIRRSYITCHDQFINPDGYNARASDNWGGYDHVGGSVKYSIPLISSECPDKQIINMIAEYWLPDNPDHIIVKGIVRVEVTGKDNTPPVMKWCRATGDNTIQVRLIDGSNITKTSVKLINKASPDKVLEFVLKDDGLNEDRAVSDNVFSVMVPEQKFGIYTIEINASDSFGNMLSTIAPGTFVLH